MMKVPEKVENKEEGEVKSAKNRDKVKGLNNSRNTLGLPFCTNCNLQYKHLEIFIFYFCQMNPNNDS